MLVAALILVPSSIGRGYPITIGLVTIVLLGFRLFEKQSPEIEKAIEQVVEERVQLKTEALVELVSHYEQQAMTDALTGLLNRRGGEESIQHHAARCTRVKTAMSFVLVDIDHFKRVNDRHGHAMGDDVISGVAQILKKVVRTADFVCRWGGEEFLVVLPDTDLSGAITTAEKLRVAVALTDFGTATPVTVSLGCAELGEDQFHIALARADMNLYLAKSKGRNQVFPKTIQMMLDRS